MQQVPTVLYTWQPSYIDQPEIIADRFTDWDDAGQPGAKWVQGFVMTADTFNVVKGLAVRDPTRSFTTRSLRRAAQWRIREGLLVRDAVHLPPGPHGADGFRPLEALWHPLGVPAHARDGRDLADGQYSTHGLRGYMHVRQMSLTYASGRARYDPDYIVRWHVPGADNRSVHRRQRGQSGPADERQQGPAIFIRHGQFAAISGLPG